MRRIFISACLVCALLGYTAEAAGPGNQPKRINNNNRGQAGSSRNQGYNNQYNQGSMNSQQMENSSSDNSEMTIRGSVVNIDKLVASERYKASSSQVNSSYNNSNNGNQNNNAGSNTGNNGNNGYNNNDNNYSYYTPQPGVIGRAPGNNSPDINRAYQRETNVDIMRTYHRTYVPPVREGNTVNSGFDVRIPDNVVSPDGALRATRFNGTATSEQARIENGKRQIAERTGRQIPSPYAASYNDRIGANENMTYNGLNENNESRYATLAPEVDNSARNGNRQGATANMNQPRPAQQSNAGTNQQYGAQSSAANGNMNAGTNNGSYQVNPNSSANNSSVAGSTGSANTKHKAYAHSKKSKSSVKSSHKATHKKSVSSKKTASNRSSSSQQPETNRVATLAPEQPQVTRHDYGLMVGSGDNAQVYLVYDKNGRIASDRLRQYANREVTVKGSVKNVNGLNVIYLDNIEP